MRSSTARWQEWGLSGGSAGLQHIWSAVPTGFVIESASRTSSFCTPGVGWSVKSVDALTEMFLPAFTDSLLGTHAPAPPSGPRFLPVSPLSPPSPLQLLFIPSSGHGTHLEVFQCEMGALLVPPSSVGSGSSVRKWRVEVEVCEE